MKRQVYIKENVKKISFFLFCFFFFFLNTNARPVEESDGNEYASNNTSDDLSCENYKNMEKKNMSELIDKGITCIYSKWFFDKYTDSSGEIVYSSYNLELKLGLLMWNRTGFGHYYVPLERINGENSYCKNKTRKYEFKKQDFYVAYSFNGGPVSYFNDNKTFDWTTKNANSETIMTTGGFRDYYANKLSSIASVLCPSYIVIDYSPSTYVFAKPFDTVSNNTLVELDSNIYFYNYLGANALDYRNPRFYERDTGKVKGISEILPLVKNIKNTVNFTSIEAKNEAKEMKALFDEAVGITNCENYKDEADKLMAAMKTKVQNVELKGFGASGPYHTNEDYVNLIPSTIKNFGGNSCHYFHNINYLKKAKDIKVYNTTFSCDNLSEFRKVGDSYRSFSRLYNEEMIYWKDRDSTEYNKFVGLKDKYDALANNFGETLNSLILSCASGLDDEASQKANDTYDEALSNIGDSISEASISVVDWANSYGLNVKDPEGIKCKDFGEGLLMKIFSYMTIIGTILLIAFGIIDFSKATLLYDENAIKKAGTNFGKRLIAAIILILLPTLVGIIIDVGVSTGIFNVTPEDCFVETNE